MKDGNIKLSVVLKRNIFQRTEVQSQISYPAVECCIRCHLRQRPMLHYSTLTSTTALRTHSQPTHKKPLPSPPGPGKSPAWPAAAREAAPPPHGGGTKERRGRNPPLRSHPVIAGSAQRFLRTAWKDSLTAHRGGTGPFAAGKPRRQRLPAPYPLPHHHHPGLGGAGCRGAQPGTGRGALTPGTAAMLHSGQQKASSDG